MRVGEREQGEQESSISEGEWEAPKKMRGSEGKLKAFRAHGI